MPANSSRIARILVIVGIVIMLLGILLYPLAGVSLPICPQPPNCYGGGVSHPFYFVSIILALIGIAIVIGSVMAYRLKTSHRKILNTI
jgi:hypothetical protein